MNDYSLVETTVAARQGHDLPLTRYDEKRWPASFYTTWMEHPPTSAAGTAWEALSR